MKRQLGVIPSGKDFRDYSIKMYGIKNQERPEKLKLDDLGEVLDQGRTGMCVAFGLSDFIARHQYKELGKWEEYSKGFIYAQKAFEGEGMIPRVAINRVTKYGNVKQDDFETIGKYSEVIANYEEYVKTYDSYTDLFEYSKFNRFQSYAKVEGIEEIKDVLISGRMVGIAVMVYSGFAKPVNGLISYNGETDARGGHWINVVGYDDDKQAFLIKNSWGKNWQLDGYAWLSYDYPIMEAWSIFDYTPAIPKNTSIKLELKRGDKAAKFNDKEFNLRVAPFFKQYSNDYSALCTELRPIFEKMGYSVYWDNEKEIVTIYK